MATKQALDNAVEAETDAFDPLDDIFGMRPEDAKDAIFLPSSPFAVRFNCQAGQFAIGDAKFLGNKTEISIVHVVRYFGDLGKTKGEEWMQIFFVPAPGSDAAWPRNTVCVAYIKTRSLSAFQMQVTQLISKGINPAEGIFKIGFEQHNGEDSRRYYSVTWEWRERQEGEELAQLEEIRAFKRARPTLADFRGTAAMVQIDGMPAEELAILQESARAEKAALAGNGERKLLAAS